VKVVGVFVHFSCAANTLPIASNDGQAVCHTVKDTNLIRSEVFFQLAKRGDKRTVFAHVSLQSSSRVHLGCKFRSSRDDQRFFFFRPNNLPIFSKLDTLFQRRSDCRRDVDGKVHVDDQTWLVSTSNPNFGSGSRVHFWSVFSWLHNVLDQRELRHTFPFVTIAMNSLWLSSSEERPRQ
jgi:hypothetical protein